VSGHSGEWQGLIGERLEVVARIDWGVTWIAHGEFESVRIRKPHRDELDINRETFARGGARLLGREIHGPYRYQVRMVHDRGSSPRG
jgi:hypothetical protein